MGDIFKEQIVKRKRSSKDKLSMFGIILGLVLASLAAFLIPVVNMLAPVIAAVLFFAGRYILTFFDVEYEYIFTNGDLDIDAIYNKKRRKRVFSGSIKSVDSFARVKPNQPKKANGVSVKDCSSGEVSDKTYSFITTVKGKKTQIIIEPNETLFTAFLAYVPALRLVK